jgi:hypothetical protein
VLSRFANGFKAKPICFGMPTTIFVLLQIDIAVLQFVQGQRQLAKRFSNLHSVSANGKNHFANGKSSSANVFCLSANCRKSLQIGFVPSQTTKWLQPWLIFSLQIGRATGAKK